MYIQLITLLTSNIPNTNDYITFNKYYMFTNSAPGNILPHFDIQFETNTFSPTMESTKNPTTSAPTNVYIIRPTKSPLFNPILTFTNIDTITPSPTKYTNISYILSTTIPSISPTLFPLHPSHTPTENPTNWFSNEPRYYPSSFPTICSTIIPLLTFTKSPKIEQTVSPINTPTYMPTILSTYNPTDSTTHNPSLNQQY